MNKQPGLAKSVLRALSIIKRSLSFFSKKNIQPVIKWNILKNELQLNRGPHY